MPKKSTKKNTGLTVSLRSGGAPTEISNVAEAEIRLAGRKEVRIVVDSSGLVEVFIGQKCIALQDLAGKDAAVLMEYPFTLSSDGDWAKIGLFNA